MEDRTSLLRCPMALNTPLMNEVYAKLSARKSQPKQFCVDPPHVDARTILITYERRPKETEKTSPFQVLVKLLKPRGPQIVAATGAAAAAAGAIVVASDGITGISVDCSWFKTVLTSAVSTAGDVTSGGWVSAVSTLVDLLWKTASVIVDVINNNKVINYLTEEVHGQLMKMQMQIDKLEGELRGELRSFMSEPLRQFLQGYLSSLKTDVSRHAEWFKCTNFNHPFMSSANERMLMSCMSALSWRYTELCLMTLQSVSVSAGGHAMQPATHHPATSAAHHVHAAPHGAAASSPRASQPATRQPAKHVPDALHDTVAYDQRPVHQPPPAGHYPVQQPANPTNFVSGTGTPQHGQHATAAYMNVDATGNADQVPRRMYLPQPSPSASPRNDDDVSDPSKPKPSFFDKLKPRKVKK